MKKTKLGMGVSEMRLPRGSMLVLSGNRLTFKRKGSVSTVLLPGRPKWMWDGGGEIVPVPDENVFLRTHELAVNPVMTRSEATRARKRTKLEITDVAEAILLKADMDAEERMAKKCAWVLKAYRVMPTVLPADVGMSLGAVAFEELAMVGG